jgi:uncharacterized protein (DUF4415 family)
MVGAWRDGARVVGPVVRFARAGRPSRPLYITMRDGRLDRLRDGKRSISFKVAVTVRYDAGIIDRFRASGDGWQTRMNDALCDWLKTHL